MPPSREEIFRRTLRNRAWDTLVNLPRDLIHTVSEEIVEEESDSEFEVVFLVRRRKREEAIPEPPPVHLISLDPIQRYLPGCGLTDIERSLIEELLSLPETERRTQPQLREAVGKRLGIEVPGEGPFKQTLARLTDPAVGVLDNDKTAHPPGYQLTPSYRRYWLHLASLEVIQKRAAEVA